MFRSHMESVIHSIFLLVLLCCVPVFPPVLTAAKWRHTAAGKAVSVTGLVRSVHVVMQSKPMVRTLRYDYAHPLICMCY
jgi:hypothetical protein